MAHFKVILLLIYAVLHKIQFPVVKDRVRKIALSQNTLVKETVGKKFPLVKDRVGKFCCC